MIGRLTGTLLEKHAPTVLIDAHGVGYEVDTPLSTFYVLPAPGERVVLHTHLVVREDAHLLYGFATEDERRVFRTLIRLTGVGAKLALAILSGLSVADLGQAVAAQATGRLTAIPGIGKKTAERLLLELKGRLDEFPAVPGAASRSPAGGDVLDALVALGYTDREAARAVAQLPGDLPVNDAIRQSLKILARA